MPTVTLLAALPVPLAVTALRRQTDDTCEYNSENLTAIVKENGDVFFFDDIYGFDKKLSKVMAQAYAEQG